MAEAFLQVVLDNLSSLIKEEIGLIMGVDDDMKKLSSTLTTIQAVLEDAELNQLESKPIRAWLRKVNALAYEIDDILDECNTHVSQLNHSDGGKLSRYGLKEVLYRRKIGRRMKKVTETLDSVAAERAKFNLREMPVDRPREVAAAASRETGSLLNEPDIIYGRDEDRDKIVKLLVEDAVDKQKVSVLPIIGVGGLGKTTLAQLVFNDPLVVNHFEKRIWVCVSDNFDMKAILRAVIESATGSAKDSELQSLEALERRFNELLSQKRYLLVLDDVWNDNRHKWFELKSILSRGSTGSSIIVTTRQMKVADIMRTLPSHSLKGLSDEHCWLLLKQRAFGQGQHEEEEKEYPELVRIGKQIVKKCAGVPLAAKALGGILRFKRKEEEWIYVRESEIWKLSAEDSLIMPALRLSYHHLPLELRQCFAYFAAFPKDYQVEKEKLITLWMAHGFVTSRGTLQAKEVGDEICNELLLRSLLQGAFTSSKKGMHDLVHDLAESIMDNNVPGLPIDRSVPSDSTVREVNLLHRYVMFPKTFQQDIDISSVMELTSLRVLDASDTGIKELPHSIGNLKHLRYLNLSNSHIRILPNSLCSLWNLQMLNLDRCYSLVALPNNTRYLRNLQHLCLEGCFSLSEMPSKMRELTRLKTLSMFVVGFNRSNQLEELQCLNLRGKLTIRHLERVKDHLDAKKANLTEKKGLRDLELSWVRNSLSKLGEDVDEKVLEALEPPSNLETLTIIGFTGRCFPFWMRNSTLGKVVRIEIVNCDNCKRLPKLGDLPHLKVLYLYNVGVEYVTEEQEEVESGKLIRMQFPALESLSLFDLPNLRGLSKEQESKESFPNLTQLRIQGCPLLVLPPLSSLQKLENLECSSSTLPLFSEVISLDTLTVRIEEKVKVFPMETLVRFTNLRRLTIDGANEISVPVEEGLQTLKRLKYLGIEDCKIMRCMPEGLLRHLTALTELEICYWPELVELPDEIKHLHNLETVRLLILPKLKCLPEALQHLSSLRKLVLRGLDELESLPDCLHQLTHLSVEDCPKLVSLPHAILHNLKSLTVEGCPELERRCKRGSGDYWPIIARIPLLQITHDTLKVKTEEKVTTFPMETLNVASTSKQNTMIEEEEEIPDSPDTELSGDGDATEETNNKAKSEVYVDKVLDIERFLKYFMSFCSLLPRYYEFSKDILVSQWVTGGLIELGEYKTAEEVCGKCFDTLVEMDYFVPSEYDYIFDRMKYKIGDGIKFDSKMINTSVVEHTSVSFKDLGVLKQYSCLQTLVIYDSYGVDHLPSDIFSELKSLNILNLSGTNVAALPSSIENLKELRLLDMSKTPIRWLPNTICYFSHLQTLNLDGCLELEHLPRCMSKLTNLQHLVLDMSRLQSIPIGMGNLSKLQMLNMFSVGMDEGRRVTELKDLNELRGSFSLSNLENVRSKDEASEACLHKKAGLRKIELHWSDVQDEKCESEEGILESLQPPLMTRELKILFYSGGVLPSWICNPSFSELVSIVLDACKYCSSLRSLGELPSLKSLTIIENNVLTEIGSSFFRFQPNPYHPYREAFPKLEKLSFESMFKLEKWTGFEEGDFPSLRLLIIEYCPVFVGTPFLSRLSLLSGLEIRYCPELSCLPEDGLPASLESLMIKQSPKLKAQCCDEQWRDWSKVALMPSIYIDDQEFSPGEPITS